jgi:uncharacterized protein
MLAFKLWLILMVTNGAPLLMAALWPGLNRWPVDNGLRLTDGRPLLGNHKTCGGLVCGILAGGLLGKLLSLSLPMSLLIAGTSMLGDLFTSFLKRRMGFREGETLYLFDQFFEGAFPLLLCKWGYGVAWPTFMTTLLVFMAGSLLGSLVKNRLSTLFARESVPDCVIRSRYGFREWRACHTALSPFARLLNFENVIYYRWVMKGVFKLLGLYGQGEKNALDVRVRSLELAFDRLPLPFRAYRILFISDLHIDGLEGLCDQLVCLIQDLDVDLCLLGGDYRMEMYGDFTAANRSLGRLVRHIHAREGIFGILGNHDCLEIAPELEDSGICILINDSFAIKRGDAVLSIVGVDDPHYYQCQDLEKAFAEVPSDGFSILLSHSPEIITDLEDRNVDLCLCGHTHAGQIRLPLLGPVFTHSRVSRKYASGLWRHGKTVGYTSSGAGSSGIPVRFNCAPEIILLTLTRQP